MSWLLAPLSWLYFLVISVRNFLFDKGFLPITHVSVPVISIGNLSAGGSGKSPLTACVYQTLKECGYSTAIISRGYGGTYQDAAIAVDVHHVSAAERYGDEPVMLAATLQAPVVVGRKRVLAAKLALEKYSVKAIVADDGYQHRYLARDIDIVLFDVTESRLHMLPWGRLREPFSCLSRATAVVLTRTDLISSSELERWRTFFTKYGFSEEKKNLFISQFLLSSFTELKSGQSMPFTSCFLLSGIGKPLIFEKMMKVEHEVQRHFVFPDHHTWTQGELDDIIKQCTCQGGYPLVVTEKDAIKLKNMNTNEYPVVVATLNVSFSSTDFKQWLCQHMERIGK